MNNVIKYYYNLNPENIVKIDKMYKFFFDNSFYFFIDVTDYNKDINEIYNISVELNNKGIYTHQFIFNEKNSIQTYVNDKTYVLLKAYSEMNQKITFEDIINFSNMMVQINNDNKLKKNDWYNLWMNKMDYFEYQISQFGKKYSFLSESFDYFEGFVETGIALLFNEKPTVSMFSICHNRINKNDTLFDLYNPLNFIIDIRIRDVVEYIKEVAEYTEQEKIIENYLNRFVLTDKEYKFFFIRFLYPTFYFDTYEKIINNQTDETKIIQCIEQIEKYEKLIKFVYIKIQSLSTLPDIEWIKKM